MNFQPQALQTRIASPQIRDSMDAPNASKIQVTGSFLFEPFAVKSNKKGKDNVKDTNERIKEENNLDFINGSSTPSPETTPEKPGNGVLELTTETNAGETMKLFAGKGSFPMNLCLMLEKVEGMDHSWAVSWSPDGSSFFIKNTEGFLKSVLPLFFRKTKLRSFYRKLNRWGFVTVRNGMNKGAWYHTDFYRERAIQSLAEAKETGGKDIRSPIIHCTSVRSNGNRRGRAGYVASSITSQGGLLDNHADIATSECLSSSLPFSSEKQQLVAPYFGLNSLGLPSQGLTSRINAYSANDFPRRGYLTASWAGGTNASFPISHSAFSLPNDVIPGAVSGRMTPMSAYGSAQMLLAASLAGSKLPSADRELATFFEKFAENL